MAGSLTGTLKYSNLADGTYVIRSAGSSGYVLSRAADTTGSNVRIEALSTSSTSRTHQQWKIQTFSATNIGEQKNTYYKGNDYRIFSASNTGVCLNLYGDRVWRTESLGTGQANAHVYTYSSTDVGSMLSIMSCPAGQYNIIRRDAWDDDSSSKKSCPGMLNVAEAKYQANQNVIFWYEWSKTYKTAQYASNVTINPGDGLGNSQANSRWTFERAVYYVKFNGNGSTSGSMANQTINIDVATALTANAFARTGYTWQGWATSASGAVAHANKASVTNLSTIHKATANLYAVWKGITWYVRYNGNGSTSGSMANSSHVYGTAKALTSNAFARTGYTFKNWNRNASGTSTAYANGASVTSLTSTSGGIIDLYAQWTANTYTVAFNANGGKGAPASVTRTYGTAKALPATKPTRSGHTFLGWSKTATATSATWAAGASYSDTTAANTTLYAIWRNDYAKPSLSGRRDFRASLEDGAYAADDEGAYGRVEFSWKATEPLDEGSVNSATVTASVQSSSGAVQALPLEGTTTGTSGTASGTFEGLVPDNSYTVTVKVVDKVGTYTFVAVIPRTSYILDVGSKGRAMGIGTAAPASGLEVGYETVLGKNVTILTPDNANRSLLRIRRMDVNNSKADNGVAAAVYNFIGFSDASNRLTAYLQNAIATDGASHANLRARTLNSAGSANVETGLTLYAYKNGTRTASVEADSLIGPNRLRLDADADNFAALMFKSKTRNSYAMRLYGDASSGDGDAIVIGDGGLLVMGAGESAANWYSRITGTADPLFKSLGPGNENTHITSDGAIYFVTSGQTIANRRVARVSGGQWLGYGPNTMSTSSTNGVTANTVQSEFLAGDSTGAWMAGFVGLMNTDGTNVCRMEARNMKTDGTYYASYFNVNVTKAGAATYSVTNAANFRSAIGAAASSDRRLKSDVEPLGEDAVEFVKALEPCVYTINGERQVGLIAQDVHEADSWGTRMAFETVEGIDGLDEWERIEGGAPTWKLDYIRLLPPTITALQRAMERIDELEAKVARLEAQAERIGELEAKAAMLDKLEARMAELESKLTGEE